MNQPESSQQIDQEPETHSLRADLIQAGKGFAMGVCDAVPGVSGGTVALVVGIYDRLFSAISRFNREWFGLLTRGKLGAAFRYADGRFLLTLLFGIVVGYVTMSKAIKILMADDNLRALTLASFSGMIIGSLWIVFGMIQHRTKKERIICLITLLIGILLSTTIALQNYASATGELSLLYLFFCAVIAICAMILPGISGAMILLILGVYYAVIDIPGSLLKLEDVVTNLTQLTVFVAGCAIGLLVFSRLIKWVLTSYRMPTLSMMMGLMLGSLVILWPFQNRIEPLVEHHKPTYEMFMPSMGLMVVGVLGCVVLFAAVVMIADRLVGERAHR